MNDIDLNSPEIQAAIEAQANKIAEGAAKGLLDKNNQLMDELKELKRFKKSLGDDFDPEEVKALKEKQAEIERKKLIDGGELEKLLAKQEEESKKKLDAVVSQNATAYEELKVLYEKEVENNRKTLVDGGIMAELSGVAINKKAAELVCKDLRDLIEVVDGDNGERIARVKGGIKADGTYRTIKDLVAEVSKDEAFAPFFKGANASGSGAPASSAGGAGKTINPWAKDTFNLTEQGRIYKESPERAQSLKAAAGR